MKLQSESTSQGAFQLVALKFSYSSSLTYWQAGQTVISTYVTIWQPASGYSARFLCRQLHAC